jgi:hypothetical protein
MHVCVRAYVEMPLCTSVLRVFVHGCLRFFVCVWDVVTIPQHDWCAARQVFIFYVLAVCCAIGLGVSFGLRSKDI